MKKYFFMIAIGSLFALAQSASAETIKLKCTGRNEYTGKVKMDVYQINASSSTVNNQSYSVLDVTKEMITWQKNSTGDGSQLPLVEINRRTGVMHITWNNGNTDDSISCEEF